MSACNTIPKEPKRRRESLRRHRIGECINRLAVSLSSRAVCKKKMSHSQIVDAAVEYINEMAVKSGKKCEQVTTLESLVKQLEQRCDYYAKILDRAGICNTRNWGGVKWKDCQVQTEATSNAKVIVLVEKRVNLSRILPKPANHLARRTASNQTIVAPSTSKDCFTMTRKLEVNDVALQTDEQATLLTTKVHRATSPVTLACLPEFNKPKRKRTKVDDRASNKDWKVCRNSASLLTVEDILQPDVYFATATSVTQASNHCDFLPAVCDTPTSCAADHWNDYFPAFTQNLPNQTHSSSQFRPEAKSTHVSQATFTIDCLQTEMAGKKLKSVAATKNSFFNNQCHPSPMQPTFVTLSNSFHEPTFAPCNDVVNNFSSAVNNKHYPTGVGAEKDPFNKATFLSKSFIPSPANCQWGNNATYAAEPAHQNFALPPRHSVQKAQSFQIASMIPEQPVAGGDQQQRYATSFTNYTAYGGEEQSCWNAEAARAYYCPNATNDWATGPGVAYNKAASTQHSTANRSFMPSFNFSNTNNA